MVTNEEEGDQKGEMAKQAAASAARGARPVAYRRPRKETSEISPLIKYLLFGFNVILWVRDFCDLISNVIVCFLSLLVVNCDV